MIRERENRYGTEELQRLLHVVDFVVWEKINDLGYRITRLPAGREEECPRNRDRELRNNIFLLPTIKYRSDPERDPKFKALLGVVK